MARHKNRQTSRAHFSRRNEKNFVRAFGIHSIGRFVQNQKSRTAQHRAANAETLPHAGGINSHAIMLTVRQSMRSEFHRSPLTKHFTEACGEFEIFRPER